MKKRLLASFTIEASILLPSILFLIIGFIYFAFYLHDRVVLEGLVHGVLSESKDLILFDKELSQGNIDYNRYLNRGIFHSNNSLDVETYIKEYAYQNIRKRFFISEVREITIEVMDNEIEMNASLNINIPFQAVKALIKKESFEITYINKIKLFERTERIRKFQVTMGIASKIEEVDNWLIKLRELMK